uniref:(northern house mosquito) hypothetical protein n=1 Tax=Culex pipiens TaxID=7175 RepID=A0A8D8FDS2_CULPI
MSRLLHHRRRRVDLHGADDDLFRQAAEKVQETNSRADPGQGDGGHGDSARLPEGPAQRDPSGREAVEYTNRRPGEHQAVRLWHQWPTSGLERQNKIRRVRRVHGARTNRPGQVPVRHPGGRVVAGNHPGRAGDRPLPLPGLQNRLRSSHQSAHIQPASPPRGPVVQPRVPGLCPALSAEGFRGATKVPRTAEASLPAASRKGHHHRRGRLVPQCGRRLWHSANLSAAAVSERSWAGICLLQLAELRQHSEAFFFGVGSK